jgi:enoyl-CoA hydratase/carnithine racemase
MATTRLSQIQNHISSPSDLVSTLYSSDRQVVTITINNAARANCLSTAVLKALLAAFTSINPKITLDSSVDSEDPIAFAEKVCRSHSPNSVPKVIILKSAGKIFSSGHDLREFHAASGDYKTIHDIFELCNTLMLTIQRLPQVVISQVVPPFGGGGGGGNIGRSKGLQPQQEHN